MWFRHPDDTGGLAMGIEPVALMRTLRLAPCRGGNRGRGGVVSSDRSSEPSLAFVSPADQHTIATAAASRSAG